MAMYSPFKKSLAEIRPEDLLVLRDVSEGWYVEYKSGVPEAKIIAKSVSAFSNHYGGWLFLGISGSKDGGNTAASFPGLPDSDLQDLQQRTRDSVAAHVNPMPYYDLVTLPVPCDHLDPPPKRSVFILRVPQGLDPPYVHSSGCIYRRLGDKSDPVPVTDRLVLDLLWRRSRQTRKQLRRLVHRKP